MLVEVVHACHIANNEVDDDGGDDGGDGDTVPLYTTGMTLDLNDNKNAQTALLIKKNVTQPFILIMLCDLFSLSVLLMCICAVKYIDPETHEVAILMPLFLLTMYFTYGSLLISMYYSLRCIPNQCLFHMLVFYFANVAFIAVHQLQHARFRLHYINAQVIFYLFLLVVLSYYMPLTGPDVAIDYSNNSSATSAARTRFRKKPIRVLLAINVAVWLITVGFSVLEQTKVYSEPT